MNIELPLKNKAKIGYMNEANNICKTNITIELLPIQAIILPLFNKYLETIINPITKLKLVIYICTAFPATIVLLKYNKRGGVGK